ncbi:MAG TPA: glycosyltransferase family 2 protein [Steroidobacteraceae bacterium]|jgi:glycosyltransferase involved in cell wall biosynthesis|nr:glycosyltransferase family 2 protein [Steroidobacteraceae bacterium]
MASISVLILTLNEEVNLAECLDSCAWCDDVVVFDSFSTDRTPQIAARPGVRFFQRPFDNYAGQRNAALADVQYRHTWVLMVDADERTPVDLVTEMTQAVANADPDTVMFRMRRKDFFLGRWLRRSSGYPSWFGRLVRLGRVRVEREVNEEYIADGKIGQLKAHLLHYPFNRGIDYWYERHNRYSSMEAIAKIETRKLPLALTSLFQRDPVDRRRVLKRLVYRMPWRPSIWFFYLYFFRLGFLDGRAGLAFSRMRASYEMIIDLKVLELERRRSGAPV